jgi:ribonucleoside-diphosphate reductase alpha chain
MGNTSPSIEPFRANAYRQDTLSGSSLNKNKYLDAIIRKEAESHKEGWYDEVWSSIIANDGSVQHLDWLDAWNKDVFKTSMEIDQRWVIQHAADRQQYIDQAQSLNLYIAGANGKKLDITYKMAWLRGLKTTYYLRTMGATHAEKSTLNTGQLNAVTVSGGVPTASKSAASAATGASVVNPSDPIIASSKSGGSSPATDAQFCSIDNPDCEACQ